MEELVRFIQDTKVTEVGLS